MRVWKWFWRLAAFALGFWILFQVLRGISWPELKDLISRAGSPLFVTLAIFPLCIFYHAMAFRALYSENTRDQMPFRELYLIKLTGEAFNKVTPFLDIGGDPVKALLLKKRGLAGMEESIAALVAFRVSYVISDILTVLLGVGLLSFRHFSADITAWALAAVFMSSVYIYIIVRSVRKFAGEAVALRASKLLRVSNPGLWKAVFWNTAGWVTLCIEAYIVLRLLEVPISFVRTFSVQALLQAVQTLTFFIPANIGSQEGGLAFLMTFLGFSAASGVALSIIKRARQIVWALAAIPLYYALKTRWLGQ